MTADLLLAIDQGSSSTRAIAFDRALRPVAAHGRPLDTRYPRPGWVEQDPSEILDSVVGTVTQVLDEVGGPDRIAAVGLDNQGETVVAWDAESGRPLAPAVSWQCRRSEPIMERLRAAGSEPEVRRRTGLPLDPYFSAGKMTWLLEQDAEVRRAADEQRLRLGTVDAWLTWHLAGGALTDPSTASRTQLLDLASVSGWSPELIDLFDIPSTALARIGPTVRPPVALRHPSWGKLPLTALVCDQQAALAGHAGFGPGAIKATYGTGVFVLATTGTRPDPAPEGLLTTVAWQIDQDPATYALEGGVFTAGVLIDWLRSTLGILVEPERGAELAASVEDSAGVRVLPALAGLGAPWWRPEARGVIAGLSAAARPAHIARAAFDSLAHSVADIVEATIAAVGITPEALRVDGGLTANPYLMQRQADLLGVPVEVASVGESTALGAAGLAGLATGHVELETIARANPVGRRFEPRLEREARGRERAAWRTFVERAALLERPVGEPAALTSDETQVGRGRDADR